MSHPLWVESVLVALASIVIAKILSLLIKLAIKWKPLGDGPKCGLLGPSLPLGDSAATLSMTEDLGRECESGVGTYRYFGYCIVLISDYETFKLYNKHRWEDGVQRPGSLVALIESSSGPDYSPYSANEKNTWSSCKAAVGGLMSPINCNENFPAMMDKSSSYWKRVLRKFKSTEGSVSIFEELLVLGSSFMFDSTFGTDFGLSTTTSGDNFNLESEPFNARKVLETGANKPNPAWEYTYHMYLAFIDAAAQVGSLRSQFATIFPKPIRNLIAPFYLRKALHEERQMEIIEYALKNSVPSKKIDDCIEHLTNVGTQTSSSHSKSVNYTLRSWLEGASGAACLAVWAILDLAKKKKVQERARAEVREALEKTGGKLEDVELSDLKFLEACFLESTRLNPAFIMTRTVVEKPLDLPQGTIPAGADVHVLCRPLLERWGREKNITDWDEFKPDRWLLDDNFKNNFPTVLCGFGHRSCVGRYMAPKAVVAALAGLLEATNSFELDTAYPLKATLEFLYYLPGFPRLKIT